MSKEVWERPSSAPYPSVWKIVEGRTPLQNGKIPRFRLQDVPKELENDVIKHMTTIFLANEPYSQFLKLSENAQTVAACTQMWREVLDFKIAIVCLLDNPEDFEDIDVPLIAGCNMTHPVVKGKQTIKADDELANYLFDAMQKIHDTVDCFEKYDVSVYMYAYGLSVHPIYRGQGLGEQILRARIPLGKAVGIQVSTTVFTNIRAMDIAKRIGFENLGEQESSKYLINGKPIFVGPQCVKLQFVAMRLY